MVPFVRNRVFIVSMILNTGLIAGVLFLLSQRKGDVYVEALPEKPLLIERPADQTPVPEPKEPESASTNSAILPTQTFFERLQDAREIVEATAEEMSTSPAAEMVAFLDDGEDQMALTAARGLLKHTNQTVRMEVLETLDWIGEPAAMDMAVLMDDPNADIRSAARESFWTITKDLGDDALRKDLLKKALQSSDPTVRISSLDAAQDLPDSLSAELFASALTDTSSEVAEVACDYLEFISGETFESSQDALRWVEQNADELPD